MSAADPCKAVLVAMHLAACSAILGADFDRPRKSGGEDDATESPDAVVEPKRDSAVEIDAARRPDAAPVILKDVACGGADNSWYLTHKDDPCAARVVREVLSGDPLALDIALDGAGHVGVIASMSNAFEAGYLSAAVFGLNENASIRTVDGEAYENTFVGAGARITRRAAGGFWVASAITFSPSTRTAGVRTLDIDAVLGEQEQAFDVVTTFEASEHKATLGVLELADETLLVTALVPGEAADKLVEITRPAGTTTFDGAPQTIVDPIAHSTSWAGEHRLVLDATATVHLVFENGNMQPAYRVRAGGGTWQNPRSLDELPPTALTHVQAALGVTGSRKRAVYLTRIDGTSEARVRIASWIGPADSLERITLAQGGMPIDDAYDYPEVSMAAASDAAGALHVVYTRIEGGDADVYGTCKVFYAREAMQDGELRWLTDDLSRPYPCREAPRVALAVEPTGRPHIVWSPRLGPVFYATRYDR